MYFFPKEKYRIMDIKTPILAPIAEPFALFDT